MNGFLLKPLNGVSMNKSRFLRTLAVLAIVAVAFLALYEVDLIGILKRLHGIQ